MVRKSGISKKMHVINFETEKKPKMKFFDFRAFRKKWAKAITWINHLSHAFPGISKYLPYKNQLGDVETKGVFHHFTNVLCIKNSPFAFASCFSSSLIRRSFSSDFVLWKDCDLFTEGGSSGRVWTLIFLFSCALCHFCAVRERSFLIQDLHRKR